MSWTKGEIVEEALAELALAGEVWDIQPEERERALRRLDAMLAMWEMKGIKLGYPMPADAQSSSLNDDSGLPDGSVETVLLNLARRIAPSYGKALRPESIQSAREGYDALLWHAAQPQQQQFPNTLPLGSGNKPWRRTMRPFMPRPDSSPLDQSTGGDLAIKE